MTWTPELEDKLAAMWGAGKSSSAIADALRMSRGKVMGRIRKLGLVGKGGHTYKTPIKHWTDEEDARLRNMRESGFSIPQIAAQLGRSDGAVGNRISKLGIPLVATYRPTPPRRISSSDHASIARRKRADTLRRNIVRAAQKPEPITAEYLQARREYRRSQRAVEEQRGLEAFKDAILRSVGRHE